MATNKNVIRYYNIDNPYFNYKQYHKRIIENDIKKARERTENSVKCKCGHSVVFSAIIDSLICDFCKHKVINTTKNHFKYKLRKELNKWNMN